jgi:hypothetical protein
MTTRTLPEALSNAARALVGEWEAKGATPKWSELVLTFITTRGYEGSLSERARLASADLCVHYVTVLAWLRDADAPRASRARPLAMLMGFPEDLVARSLIAADAAPRQDAEDHDAVAGSGD